jgi:hypothetical protein
MIPNANSPYLCPYTLVTGRKLSMKTDLRFQFGSVVVVNNTPPKPQSPSSSSPSPTSSDRSARGVVAIVVGKDRDVQGGMRVYIPSQHVIVVRRYAKPGSLSSDLIDLLNRKASESRQKTGNDKVVSINGRVISPQPFVEDTIPPGMTCQPTRGDRSLNLPHHPTFPQVDQADSTEGTSLSSPLAVRALPEQEAPPPPPPSSSPPDLVAPRLVSPTPPPSSPPADQALLAPPLSPSATPTDQDISSRVEPPNETGLPSRGGHGEAASAVPRYSRRDRKTTWKTIGLKNGFHTANLTIKQASRRYPNMVEQAIRKEIRQLVERGTFVPVHGAPKGEKVVHSSVMMTQIR